jgi:hypothetical protein
MMHELGRSTPRTVVLGAWLSLLAWSPSVQAEDIQTECIAAADQAQVLRSAHKLKEARAELLNCARPACPTVIGTDCTQWLSEVDAVLPSVVIRAYYPSGADAVAVRVLVDGELLANRLDGLALSVDPGIHVFRYELAGMRPVEQQIVAREGERLRALLVQFEPVLVTPDPQPVTNHDTRVDTGPSHAKRDAMLRYALAGVGVVALGSYAYFGLRGLSERSDLAAGCGATRTCSNAQVDPIRTKFAVADISLAIGLVSLGVATWLFLSKPAPKPAWSAQTVSPSELARSGRAWKCVF